MTTCYVFFRCWPGFKDNGQFSIDQFNSLSDDELPDALDVFAREQLHARKPEIKEIWKERRKQFLEQVSAQQKKVLPGPEPEWGRRPRMGRGWLYDRIRHAPRHWTPRVYRPRHAPCDSTPLICRVGGWLGWWGGSGCVFYRAVTGPRVCFVPVRDQDFTEYVVGKLNGRCAQEDPEALGDGYRELNPRFGFVAAESLSRQEQTSIRRQINSIRDGEEPPVQYRERALYLGQPALEFARKEAEAWGDVGLDLDQEEEPTAEPADGAGGNPPKAESAVLDDPITFEQLAQLLLLEAKTIQNRGTKGRPKPAIGGGKGKRAIWSYRTLRPWLLDEFPDREDRLPEDYAEAKELFSAPKCPPGNS